MWLNDNCCSRGSRRGEKRSNSSTAREGTRAQRGSIMLRYTRRWEMSMSELEMFFATWDREAESTLKLLRALPMANYDFRPDAGGRSLGELAWHLAEGDAYMPYGIEQGTFDFKMRPPGIERPLEVKSLATGYRRVHDDAVQRIKRFTPEQLDKSYTFF